MTRARPWGLRFPSQAAHRSARASIVAAVAAASIVLALPASAQQTPSAELSLASQTPWMRSDSFTMRLDLDRVRRPHDLDLVVTVHRAVTSRSQFRRTIDGRLPGGQVYGNRIPLEDLTFDASGAAPVTIQLPSLRTGVYPVRVEVAAGSDVVASFTTHMIRVPPEPAAMPLAVAWVQPYGAPPALQADGTIALPDKEVDELRTIAAHLDAGSPLTIVPTPETIAALSTLDDGQTVDALDRLLQGHQVLSTPFVELDVNAFAAAGRTDDLLRQRAEGGEVLSKSLGVAGDTRTWSLPGTVTPAALDALSDLGVERVVLDETALAPLPPSLTGGLTLARPFLVDTGRARGQLAAVAADEGLTAHFEADDDVLAAYHLLADLAVLQLDAPGNARGVVIRPPVDWTPSDALLSATLGNLAASPLLKPVTLDRLFADIDRLADVEGEPVVRELLDGDPSDADPSDRVPGVDRARALAAGVASLTGSSNPELDVLDRLLLVSQARGLGRAAQRAYIDGARERISSLTGRVRVLGDRTYRLTAREGTIPLTLVNDNPFDVLVAVELSSEKLEFDGEPLARIDIAAKRTVTQAVPVRALTSGTFPLAVTIRSPDGSLELARTRITITSTVASGVGVALSAGAALFLLLWWGTHHRTVGRARRLIPPGPEGERTRHASGSADDPRSNRDAARGTVSRRSKSQRSSS